jgi:hypothetical protein
MRYDVAHHAGMHGIGRQPGLKNQGPSGRVGSTPTPGTLTSRAHQRWVVLGVVKQVYVPAVTLFWPMPW